MALDAFCSAAISTLSPSSVAVRGAVAVRGVIGLLPAAGDDAVRLGVAAGRPWWRTGDCSIERCVPKERRWGP